MAEGLSKFFDKLLDPKKKKGGSGANHSSSIPANGNHQVQQAGVGQQHKACSRAPCPTTAPPPPDALSSSGSKQAAAAAAAAAGHKQQQQGLQEPCPLCSQPADVHLQPSLPQQSQQQQDEEPMNFNGSLEERRAWIERAQGQAFAWDFDVFDFGNRTQGNPLISMTIALLELHNLMDGWRLNRRTVENFLKRVEAGYCPNSYHNNIHATDVTQTAAIILESFRRKVGNDIPKMDIFCIIMASAVHDLGHLGVNNDFLINSRHPRATTYNDKSVNENYHIARAFELARTNQGCDIFELFTFDEQKKCRQLMIDVVLATDMAIHFELLKNFNSQMEAVPDVSQWQDRNLLYRMIVHLADIANPSRPFSLARPWAERVIAEFCQQGDKEQQAGLSVSPFCNRANMNMPKAQLGFIDIFVKPTLQAFEGAAPDFIQMALQQLENTIAEWKRLESEGVRMPAGL